MTTKPVAMISMPSLSGKFPSFQIALLKATLERTGISVECFSLFMHFGRKIGWKINEELADLWPGMLGEWIWSKAAFGDDIAGRDAEYFATFADSLGSFYRKANCTEDRLRQIRDCDTLEFISYWVEAQDWSRFSLVGFSVVFQQTLASLAMAKALKLRYPDLPIILGGASIEDDIGDEIMRHCSQIDYVHCGDAELALPEVVRRIGRGQSMQGLRGPIWRNQGAIEFAGRAPNYQEMNRSAIPDFSEYFTAREAARYDEWEGAFDPMLLIETARGCWWGEKSHCTFCGLNSSGMEFRAKTPEAVIEELEFLTRTYGVFLFSAIDNIMAPDNVEGLFGALAKANSDIKIHYQIRASFSRAQLGRLHKGGLFSVQPGIESFSTNMLKEMRKSTTGMRNLELIKWCTYLGIVDIYNLLFGFPEEEEEQDYAIHERVIRSIPHFQPPNSIAQVRVDRGSPMFKAPSEHSVANLRPARAYEFLFPPEFNLNRISYFYDHNSPQRLHPQYRDMVEQVQKWQDRWNSENRPMLRYRKAVTSIVIEDRRNQETQFYVFEGRPAELYEYCADARTAVEIGREFGDPDWVAEALRNFAENDLVLELDDRYLSLALPENQDFGEVDPYESVGPRSQPDLGECAAVDGFPIVST